MLQVPMGLTTANREWWRLNFSKTATGRAGPVRWQAEPGRAEKVGPCRRLIVNVDCQHVTQSAA